MAEAPKTFEEWWVGSYYRKFVEREGVPLYEGSIIEDLNDLTLGEWERRGGKAAYTRMANQEDVNLQIVEIPPKGELKPEHHMYESIMYVMKGRGATSIWQEGEPKTTVEWEEGALLAIPLNAWHQEFNSSGDEPCKLLFGTNMAQVINLYHNLEFVFNNPFQFKDRYSHSMKDFYSDEGKHWNLRLFATNFIPDIRKFKLDEWKERGIRTSITRLYMGNSLSQLHLLEVSEGTYVTAHRHGAGAHVVMIEGGGYELMFDIGDELNPEKRRKFPLKPCGVVAPRLNEYHQHFNTAKGPIRQLAFRGWVRRPAATNAKGEYDPVGAARSGDKNAYSYAIKFADEDPKIREEYYKELEKTGVTLRLEPMDQGGG
ncbi:MAG: cupin domain-containing protein [Deltaproteobacteria bacterium]|nr:cupin domain-containing protein [Deltaproteobacteria bacterium]